MMRLSVREIGLFRRPVTFRFPFRFGAARVEAAPQAFVRARVADDSGRESVGWAAEMMMPRWFDKNPALTAEQNVAQLGRALALGAQALSAAGAGTPFALHRAAAAPHAAACAAEGLPSLVASYGLALPDRAILDAALKLGGVTAAAGLRANLPGVTAEGLDIAGWLSARAPAPSIGFRHTVGLGDALGPGDPAEDGLPRALPEVIATYAPRWFKLKLSGDAGSDVARLTEIAAVLDALPDYAVTLDGNEQFPDAAAVAALLDAIDAEPRLRRLRAATAYLEQPIARAEALAAPLGALAARIPVIIDESDGADDAWPRAQALGYAGVSAKSCKGLYRALLNGARVARDGGFISAEDLTTQPGLAIQQDLALAAFIGCAHAERNGHHFVDGMDGAPDAERAAFAAAHPDLYAGPRARLRVEGGRVALGSTLAAAGLGAAVEPDIRAMEAMP